ncbi:MAG: hypothetical protein ABIK92_01435 [Pseudomonadota bacterium]
MKFCKNVNYSFCLLLILLAVFLINENVQARSLPSNVTAANNEFSSRQKAIIERWLWDLYRNGIGNFKDDAGTKSFRRIAAGLLALKENDSNQITSPGAAPLYRYMPPANFPQIVETWTTTIKKIGIAGTATHGDGNYDMKMKEMITLLYLFKNDSKYLTNQACFNIVDKGLSYYMGQSTDKKKVIHHGITYPETENHILMIFSSQYLTNQWISDNPRNDNRLRTGKYGNRNNFINQDKEVEDLLLQATGRIVHNGFFETNGRPYQALSMHALLNIFSFANNSNLKKGARNALDYLSTKFAFQSFQGKRFGPHRRNSDYAKKLGLYENDGVIFMMGILSGAYNWENSFFNDFSNSSGHALWASLLDYRIPDVIHDFMLNKHNGYWARMQARYSTDHYKAHQGPRYFDKNCYNYIRGKNVESAPEFYFATNDFMNISGGKYNRFKVTYDIFQSSDNSKYLKHYDFASRPHLLMTKHNIPQWENDNDMKEHVMFMKGRKRHWLSDNAGTYKSFSYGYYKYFGDAFSGSIDKDRDNTDRHLEYPMRYPSFWDNIPYRLIDGNKKEFSTSDKSRVRFSFFDLTSLQNYGYYVVIGRVSKNENKKKFRTYARGFWEIVPRHKFANLTELKNSVLENNPDSNFNNKTGGDSKWYLYKMTTGETVELNILLGYDDNDCLNPIRKIWPKGSNARSGRQSLISNHVYNRCSKNDINNFPLIEVKEVNRDFNFTGRKYAYSSGNGTLYIKNPFLRKKLTINSSFYKRPTRTIQTLR